jgi:ESS family glutamate:Na+ symporter
VATLLSFPVLADFGIISILLIISHLLRNRIKFLQNTYVPTSIIAGLLGLFGGSQFLDILPFTLNENNIQNINSYPSFLVVLLFSTLFLGKRKKKNSIKKTIEQAGDTFFFNLASIVGQYGFSLLLGFLLLEPLFPYLPKGFAILLPIGFAGGHGTVSAMGGVLESYGMAGALSLGYAAATVGILIGILGGMIIINIGIRLGYTRLVKSVQEMPFSMRSGFVPEAEQQHVGKETTSTIALDSLSWHVAIVFACATFSYKIAAFIIATLGLSVPVFCIALLVGALAQKILNIAKLGSYVDRHLIHHMGSMITDFLVAFGVASISVKVILNFAFPLCLLFTFGTLLSLAFIWFLGRRLCHNFWFERSMLMFGWNVGTVAISMVLVRVLDPDIQSGVLEDFGLSYFGIAFIEISLISIMPHLIGQGIIIWPAIVLIIIFFACILMSRFMIGWFSASPTALREDEEGALAGRCLNE